LSVSDQFCEDLVWGHEVEDFARSVVEAFGDDVEVVLGVVRQVGSLGKILRITVTGITVTVGNYGNYGDSCNNSFIILRCAVN
jgi:hypothetical protein